MMRVMTYWMSFCFSLGGWSPPTDFARTRRPSLDIALRAFGRSIPRSVFLFFYLLIFLLNKFSKNIWVRGARVKTSERASGVSVGESVGARVELLAVGVVGVVFFFFVLKICFIILKI